MLTFGRSLKIGPTEVHHDDAVIQKAAIEKAIEHTLKNTPPDVFTRQSVAANLSNSLLAVDVDTDAHNQPKVTALLWNPTPIPNLKSDFNATRVGVEEGLKEIFGLFASAVSEALPK